MAYNKKQLVKVLSEMKATFIKDPNTAVRGQNFIKQLHQYCIDELRSRGLVQGDLLLDGELKILTSHKFKDTDVALVHPTSGPLLILGVRSQMSSLSKNFLNYYEMEVGDVYAIHERYPLCVVGLVYLHPEHSILPGKEAESFDFQRAERMFALISGRSKPSDPYGHYEEIAYLRVNFRSDPPTIDNDFPTNREISIENFFDKLFDKFVQRNFPLLK